MSELLISAVGVFHLFITQFNAYFDEIQESPTNAAELKTDKKLQNFFPLLTMQVKK